MNRPQAARRDPHKGFRRAAPLFFAAVAVLCLSQGGWIYAKAALAQILIERSWQKALPGEAPPPWPWADTYPVARLRVPRLDIDTFVLAGSSGRTLAFGPGHMAGTPLPGQEGNSVIGGHRDTHFAFLEDLEIGDELIIEDTTGAQRTYRVQDLAVTDHKDTSPLLPTDHPHLTLVTCYPFEALTPGGPLRYVVTARTDREPGERSTSARTD